MQLPKRLKVTYEQINVHLKLSAPTINRNVLKYLGT